MRSTGWSILVCATVFTLSGTVARAQEPSGERQLGMTVIEPGYDDATGDLIYVTTPIGAPFPAKADEHAVSPLYLIVYPDSAATSVGTMNCAHEGGDNCPDHGPGIANVAQSVMPSVYGSGVWGHDHIMDAPGGREFNVAWHVIVVLFTNTAAANNHITTEEQLDAFVDSGDAIELDSGIVFNCSVVPAAPYNRGTPVPSVE